MDFTEQLKSDMEEIAPELVDHFQWLHQHPELSYQEFRTTEYIKKELAKLPIKLLPIDSPVGVVGLLKGGKPGKCVALRADIDALPIPEDGTQFCHSNTPGVSHACGHDSHITCLLGAAKLLSKQKEKLCGNVKFIFQPAEEGAKGAEYFVKKGCMEQPKVDAIFGLHNAPTVTHNVLGLTTGGIMAAVHKFHVTLTGVGGHGAIPETNVDAIVAASAIIQSLQTIVSRNVAPMQSAVVSVCSLHAGDGLTFNVNPSTVEFAGTCRCYSSEMEDLIQQRFHSIVTSVAHAYQVTADIEYERLHKAVINSESLYAIAVKAAESLELSYVKPTPSTAGDDFSTFSDYAPAYFFWLGNHNEEKDCVYPLHSPRFKIDTHILSSGAGIYAMAAYLYLNHTS